MIRAFLLLIAAACCCLQAWAGALLGRVLAGDDPLPFATVRLDGTGHRAFTDEAGRFRLERVPAGTYLLRVAALGQQPWERSVDVPEDTLDLGDLQLAPAAGDLDELVVSATLRPIRRSDSPVPVEVIAPALFRKSPSPSLFDAIGLVNGVRPQINCSVCNTGDIHINGMEGPYTMVLIDGMPIVSGLSTVYGLSGIPTSLIERVEVVKGPGSALYGSEAMGGLINVITKDPVLAPRVSADVMTTSWRETNVELGVRLGQRKVRDLFGMSAFSYQDPRDANNDGFTDVTLQQRISLFNKVRFVRPLGRVAALAGRIVAEDRWGGQLDWTPRWAGSDSIYGESIRTRRWELVGHYQLPVPGTVMVQWSANGHRQRSWYGTRPYDADQRVLFAQAYWSHRLKARHDLLAGMAYRFTWYDDDTPATADATSFPHRNAPQRTPLPGVFAQDEWHVTDVHTVLVGARADHDAHHGPVVSPRVAYKWSPSGRWTVRAHFGTGYRVVNIFTEDHAALTGARTVIITEDLRPERSVNGTVNVVRRWTHEARSLEVDASLYHTAFNNRILPDYDSDPDLILYRNLAGRAVSRGASLNLSARIGEPWRLLAGATYMDVFTEEGGRRTEQYFAPRWSGTFSVSASRPEPWTFDLTGRWYGPMRLPTQPNDFRPDHAPFHLLLDVQARRRFGKRWEAYAGIKNLLDFVPRDPLMRPFDPFDKNAGDPVTNPNGYTFDTAYMYAPLQGIRGFAGVRWTLE